MTAILSVFIILVLLQQLLRLFPKLSLVIFIVGSLMISYNWLQNFSYEPFVYIKFYSVIIGVFVVELCRLTKLGHNRYFLLIPAIFLALNILEAVIKDFAQCDLPHILNGMAGLMLCIGLSFFGSLHVNRELKNTDLIWEKMTLAWVISYTLWNWTFIYLNFPQNCGIHIGVLLAPLTVALINPSRWGQTRAHSLAIYFTLRFLFEPFLPSDFFATASWQSKMGYDIASAMSFSLAATWFCFRLFKIFQQSKTSVEIAPKI